MLAPMAFGMGFGDLVLIVVMVVVVFGATSSVNEKPPGGRPATGIALDMDHWTLLAAAVLSVSVAWRWRSEGAPPLMMR